MKRKTLSLLLLAVSAPVWAAPAGEAFAPQPAQTEVADPECLVAGLLLGVVPEPDRRLRQASRPDAPIENLYAAVAPQFRQALLRRMAAPSASRQGVAAMRDARFYLPALAVQAEGSGSPALQGGWLRLPQTAAGGLPRSRY